MAFASSFLGSACPIVILSPSLRSRINPAKNRIITICYKEEILRLTPRNDISTPPLDPSSGQIHSGFRLSTEGRKSIDSNTGAVKARFPCVIEKKSFLINRLGNDNTPCDGKIPLSKRGLVVRNMYFT